MTEEHRRHNEAVLATLEMGDLVEFPRSKGFSHWVVYIGDEEIVHLSPASTSEGFVKQDKFWTVAEGSNAKKNNDKDALKKPFKGTKIKERALEKLGSSPYNVVSYNCEHFANYCRYGICDSAQVNAVTGTGIWRTITAFVVGIFHSPSISSISFNPSSPSSSSISSSPSSSSISSSPSSSSSSSISSSPSSSSSS